jgi:hypothetical protein
MADEADSQARNDSGGGASSTTADLRSEVWVAFIKASLEFIEKSLFAI